MPPECLRSMSRVRFSTLARRFARMSSVRRKRPDNLPVLLNSFVRLLELLLGSQDLIREPDEGFPFSTLGLFS